MATVASAVAAAAALDVPESQRLIALSLGKIAASRGQKGGINLHKNLLVATVLTKARAAYMIQHMNAARQRAAQVAAASSPSSFTSPQCVEMKEPSPEQTLSRSSTTSTTTTTIAATSSPSPMASPAATPQSVTQESPSVPEGTAGSCAMQVAENEDKENTPPPLSAACCRDASVPLSFPPMPNQDCEKRLQVEADSVKEPSKSALSSRPVDSHRTGPHSSGGYVSRPSGTCCLLKRRRTMDRDHENVSAPKVRIVESRVSFDSDSSVGNPAGVSEPMQYVDSPQISNLVNIFSASFSGLTSGQSVLLSDSSQLSYCAKEMKASAGLDSVHQPSLLLSV